MRIKVKKIYEARTSDDGVRILVDRMWPRGVTKEAAQVDQWYRDIAPSTGLRRWFNHDEQKWDEFKRRYFEELDANERGVKEIKDEAERATVTLLFSAKDSRLNNAEALREYLITKHDGNAN